jgi:predicted RNA binding protein YcfA (HicA-like mRNA interferase family)
MKRRELIRKFRKLGFQGPLQGKKHPFMVRGHQRVTLPNPHRSDEVDIGLVRRILRQAGIDPGEFDKA